MSARQWALAAAVLFSQAAAGDPRWRPLEPLQADEWYATPLPSLQQAPQPTAQPPTRDQDQLLCANPSMPEVINLQPQQTSWFSRSGKWYGKERYEIASWTQNRFRIDYLNVDYVVGLKPWFTAHVLRNPDKELEYMNIFLPPPKSDAFYGAMTTIVYKDCEQTPMYVSRELGHYTRTYEIFNQLGELVATGSPSKMTPGQFFFKDLQGLAFALAGSPSIAAAVGGNVAYGGKWSPPKKDKNPVYDFDHWQVWYMGGYNSNTYLKEPMHRWVIAAVVQEHALMKTLQLNPSSASQYTAFVILSAVLVLGLMGVCLCAFVRIFRMVYPPKKRDPNPFMTMDIGGHPYGSFALAHQRP